MEQIRDLLSLDDKRLDVKSGVEGNFVPGLVVRQVRHRGLRSTVQP